MRPARLLGVLAAGVLVVDQLTKQWALHRLAAGPIPVLPGVFHLTLVKNPGVAFGLFARLGWLAMAAALLVAAALVVAAVRRPWHLDRPAAVALGLLAGGAVGNLIDRLRVGAVVDFLDVRVWPVFNVADSCITVGVVLMLWQWWPHHLSARHRRAPKDGPAGRGQVMGWRGR